MTFGGFRHWGVTFLVSLVDVLTVPRKWEGGSQVQRFQLCGLCMSVLLKGVLSPKSPYSSLVPLSGREHP